MNKNLKEGLAGAKAVSNRALEITKAFFTDKNIAMFWGMAASLIGVCGALLGGEIVGGIKGVMVGFGVGAACVGAVSASVVGIGSALEGIGENIKNNNRAKKLGAILAGVVLASPIAVADVAAAKFIYNNSDEYKKEQALIEEANTTRFNDELQVSGKFNKATNTYTIESVAGENIPKDANIKFELNK